jgi:hypothetical protein
MTDHMALLVSMIVLVPQLGIPIRTFPVPVSVFALATGRMSFMTASAAADRVPFWPTVSGSPRAGSTACDSRAARVGLAGRAH